MKIFAISFFICCLCGLVSGDDSLLSFSEKKYVNDATHSLSSEEVSLLDEKLRLLDQDEGIQLIVVVSPTLGSSTIEDTAQLFMTHWQIGNRERDSGCLLLIAAQEKTSYIELGYGLAGRMDEKIASEICQNDINPLLEKGQVALAVQKGVKAIFLTMGVDFSGKGPHESEWWGKASLVFCFINVFLLFLLARFASSRYWWLSPIIGFAIGITQSFGFAIIMSIFATVMVLLCIIVRKRFQR